MSITAPPRGGAPSQVVHLGQAGVILLRPLVVWVRFPLARFHLGRGRLTAATPTRPWPKLC